MKTKNYMVKIINRIKVKKEVIGGSAFILFSLFFFGFSILNYNNSNSIVNEIERETKENNISDFDDIKPLVSPIERNIVSLHNYITEDETLVEEIITEETTTEKEKETETEIETQVEKETETQIETETEIETEIQIEIETEIETEMNQELIEISNYSTLDEYIYSLINEYSGYNTRISLTYDNVLLLGQLIESEAGDEPFEGKIAVGEVVLNRLSSSSKYSNIHDVIFEPNQFSVVSNGSIYNTPSNDSILATIQAIIGESPTGGAIYFDDPRICTSWASKNRPYGPRIGNHQFYY